MRSASSPSVSSRFPQNTVFGPAWVSAAQQEQNQPWIRAPYRLLRRKGALPQPKEAQQSSGPSEQPKGCTLSRDEAKSPHLLWNLVIAQRQMIVRYTRWMFSLTNEDGSVQMAQPWTETWMETFFSICMARENTETQRMVSIVCLKLNFGGTSLSIWKDRGWIFLNCYALTFLKHWFREVFSFLLLKPCSFLLFS